MSLIGQVATLLYPTHDAVGFSACFSLLLLIFFIVLHTNAFNLTREKCVRRPSKVFLYAPSFKVRTLILLS